ncbi:hypothetical protein FNZ56_10355 [Pseudoluteimonas lycopersici]|uniref:Glycosyltransferase family 1 protein n=1 Tax=Pseudoluteimonas lycopersici TaxID=1324796 RepID=A0A516V6T8_9GAMM|nr:hypothetical protein [Lysobacter lycopersici]QDQ74256.1 hypothetical protein FNZ56_10355 [Lysobacter lycopersici]
MASPVTFFLDADDATLAAWRGLQPDREPRRMVLGEDYWVVQTWARLRDAGMPVALDNRVPDEGVVVFYAGDKRVVWKQLRAGNRALLAAVRSDRHPVGFADVEIVQNASSADGVRAVYLPHWPQPGLLARDPARGDALRVVLFPGTPQNLAADFDASDWHSFVQARGIEFRCRYGDDAAAWNDYRDVDALLAIRPGSMGLVRNKPAWKLFNAWLAGIPAILGPESGYRELRQGPLDFLEAATPAAAMQALQRLQDEPGLYRAMVDNGLARGAEYTMEATRARWIELLDGLASRRAAWRRPPALATRRVRDLHARLRRMWRKRG